MKEIFMNIDDILLATENPNKKDSAALIPSFDTYAN